MQVWYSFLDEFKALKKKSAPFKHYGDKGGIYDDKNYIPLTVVDAIQKEGGSKNANQMMIWTLKGDKCKKQEETQAIV